MLALALCHMKTSAALIVVAYLKMDTRHILSSSHVTFYQPSAHARRVIVSQAEGQGL